jgi:hypothetical protein
MAMSDVDNALIAYGDGTDRFSDEGLIAAGYVLAAEVLRFRKLFDDAGQGEHNVLALVEHYQAQAIELGERPTLEMLMRAHDSADSYQLRALAAEAEVREMEAAHLAEVDTLGAEYESIVAGYKAKLARVEALVARTQDLADEAHQLGRSGYSVAVETGALILDALRGEP